MLYNIDSPKRGSSDVENVLYNVQWAALYTTSTTGLFYLFTLFCAIPSSGVHRQPVRPDSEVRLPQTRSYVIRCQPTTRHSMEQPAKCNNRIIDSKIQASSIYGIQSHMYSTFGDSGVHVQPNSFPFVALALQW